MKIAFFGHDASDAAIRRRVVALEAAGYPVTGFMMRRDEDRPRLWENVDLGQTYDGAYGQRLQAIYQGSEIALRHQDVLRDAGLFYARNLDMLICTIIVRQRLGLAIPVVYECLDVHHLLSQQNVMGLALRAVERRLIRETSLLVYSSPAFEREYFAKHFAGLYQPFLLENRLVPGETLAARLRQASTSSGKLRIGWFGILRCARSLSLLTALAAQYPEDIEIIIRGIPAETQVPDFAAEIAAHPNIHFGGPYEAPQDLDEIYNSVDLVWAGDFYQAGQNSRWLLPNRIYEGGYFATPAIAPAASETGNWVSRREAGFSLPEPLEVSLPALVQQLLARPEAIREKASVLAGLSDEIFIQPDDEMKKLIAAALGSAREKAAA